MAEQGQSGFRKTGRTSQIGLIVPEEQPAPSTTPPSPETPKPQTTPNENEGGK